MNFFLRDFAVTQKFTHLSNVQVDFQFNAVCHRQSAATHTIFMRLAENDVTVMPSVTCLD
jgi:hypothetical protein